MYSEPSTPPGFMKVQPVSPPLHTPVGGGIPKNLLQSPRHYRLVWPLQGIQSLLTGLHSLFWLTEFLPWPEEDLFRSKPPPCIVKPGKIAILLFSMTFERDIFLRLKTFSDTVPGCYDDVTVRARASSLERGSQVLLGCQNFVSRLSVRCTQSQKNCNINSWIFPGAQGQGHVGQWKAISDLGFQPFRGFLMTLGHMTLTLDPRTNSWSNVAILSRLCVHANPVKLQHGRGVSRELLLGLQKWFSCKSVQKSVRKWLEATAN